MDKDTDPIVRNAAGPASPARLKDSPRCAFRRVAWVSDLHLNFCGEEDLDVFLEFLAAGKPEALLVGGDTGEAPSIVAYLQASHLDVATIS